MFLSDLTCNKKMNQVLVSYVMQKMGKGGKERE